MCIILISFCGFGEKFLFPGFSKSSCQNRLIDLSHLGFYLQSVSRSSLDIFFQIIWGLYKLASFLARIYDFSFFLFWNILI